jgi:integrase
MFERTRQALASWIAPKAMPRALAGGQWFGTNYTDLYKRNREPTANELMAELKGTAWTCASLNAAVRANYYPRLFVTTQTGQAAPRAPVKALDRRTEEWLRSRKDLPARWTKAAKLQEVTDHVLLDLVNLHTALKWAVDNRYLPAVPTFPTVKVPKRKPKPIDPMDFAKLLAVAPSDAWRAYLLCAWLGGLRLSEAANLRRHPSEEYPWLDLPGDRIWLPAKFTKVAEDQWIPLHPDLRRALEALPDTGDEIFAFNSRRRGRLTRQGFTRTVLDLPAKAGVKLSMHRLRKGFGCRVAQQLGKGQAPVLHRLMRHRSMQMTMDYYANVDDVLADSIRQLDQPRGPETNSTATSTNSHPQAPESKGAMTQIQRKSQLRTHRQQNKRREEPFLIKRA